MFGAIEIEIETTGAAPRLREGHPDPTALPDVQGQVRLHLGRQGLRRRRLRRRRRRHHAVHGCVLASFLFCFFFLYFFFLCSDRGLWWCWSALVSGACTSRHGDVWVCLRLRCRAPRFPGSAFRTALKIRTQARRSLAIFKQMIFTKRQQVFTLFECVRGRRGSGLHVGYLHTYIRWFGSHAVKLHALLSAQPSSSFRGERFPTYSYIVHAVIRYCCTCILSAGGGALLYGCSWADSSVLSLSLLLPLSMPSRFPPSLLASYYSFIFSSVAIYVSAHLSLPAPLLLTASLRASLRLRRRHGLPDEPGDHRPLVPVQPCPALRLRQVRHLGLLRGLGLRSGTEISRSILQGQRTPC